MSLLNTFSCGLSALHIVDQVGDYVEYYTDRIHQAPPPASNSTDETLSRAWSSSSSSGDRSDRIEKEKEHSISISALLVVRRVWNNFVPQAATHLLLSPLWHLIIRYQAHQPPGFTSSNQQSFYRPPGMIESFRKIVQQEGVSAFWRGSISILLAIFIQVFFNQLARFVDQRKQQRKLRANIASPDNLDNIESDGDRNRLNPTLAMLAPRSSTSVLLRMLGVILSHPLQVVSTHAVLDTANNRSDITGTSTITRLRALFSRYSLFRGLFAGVQFSLLLELLATFFSGSILPFLFLFPIDVMRTILVSSIRSSDPSTFSTPTASPSASTVATAVTAIASVAGKSNNFSNLPHPWLVLPPRGSFGVLGLFRMFQHVKKRYGIGGFYSGWKVFTLALFPYITSSTIFAMYVAYRACRGLEQQYPGIAAQLIKHFT